jgi:FecR protein
VGLRRGTGPGAIGGLSSLTRQAQSEGANPALRLRAHDHARSWNAVSSGPAGQDGLPPSVRLDSGALLIEFHSKRRHEFQILTPATIASVRGTKWAMEVKPGQTSTLVLEGRVTVRRKDTAEGVVVGPGQGVDVFTGEAATGKKTGARPTPFVAKRWAPARVKALLAKFSQRLKINSGSPQHRIG